MSKFFVKKKISLVFLGEDYKDAYIILKTVPVTEYEKLFKNTKEMTNIESTRLALNTIKERFISGEFPDENGKLTSIVVSDLDAIMDEQALNECYLTILGQRPDPKS